MQADLDLQFAHEMYAISHRVKGTVYVQKATRHFILLSGAKIIKIRLKASLKSQASDWLKLRLMLEISD
jgi:hypothetical protein